MQSAILLVPTLDMLTCVAYDTDDSRPLEMNKLLSQLTQIKLN
jgi:hypothetical protein